MFINHLGASLKKHTKNIVFELFIKMTLNYLKLC